MSKIDLRNNAFPGLPTAAQNTNFQVNVASKNSTNAHPY